MSTELEKRVAQLETQVARLSLGAPNADCYTYKDVALAVGCSPQTIRNAEKNGEIVTKFPNAKKRFCRSAVEAYLRGRKKWQRKN